MKITKNEISTIIDGLLAEKEASIKKMQEELAEYATAIAMEKTPVIVREAFEKHPDYIEASNHILFRWHGHKDSVVSGVKVPSDGSYSRCIEITSESTGKKLSKMINALENADKEKNDLRNQLYSILTTLGTHARITKELPEAIPFLKEKESAAVALSIPEIRKKLHKM